MRILAVFIACLSIAAISISSVAAVGTVDSFRLVQHYSSPTGGAEIVAASPDGMTLAYSDATSGSVGFLDITDPADMSFLGAIETAGEPSSAAFSPDGEWVFAAVKTYVREEGAPANLTPGLLYVIDADTRVVAGTVEIGVQPDSLKAFVDGSDIKVVIAIENEPLVVEDGVQTDDDEPGIDGDVSGPGLIQVVTINTANVAASAVEDILLPEADMTAAGLEFADDPQPEFVDIRGMTAAVSLQENNGFVVIDLTDNSIVGIYSSGVVDDRPADLESDSVIDFSGSYPADVAGEDYAGLRFSDSLAFNAAGTVIYAADEGEFDYTGGRGVSAWSNTGELLWDDGGEIEAMAVRTGMYPEGRSDAKGVEMEGLTVATFDGTPFALYLSERGSFLAVYNISNPTNPTLVQVLGTGIAPEGIVAIPGRNLVVTAEEEFGSFTIFEGVDGPWAPDADRPVLRSASVDVPWCALSGLDDAGDGKLVGIPDSAYAPTKIFEIQTGSGFAALTTPVTIMREGEEATYDGEGIAVDTSDIAPANPGWWIGSEGNAAFGDEDYLPNLLVQVDGDGEVLREVWLPETIDSPGGGTIRSNGYEGVALSGDGRYALAPIQRQFTGESAAFTRIARVDLTTLECDGITCTGEWEFFKYPLDAIPAGATWVALSELSHIEDETYAVIERDNVAGGVVKKIYAFTLEGLGDGDTIQKALWVDVQDDFFPYEKVEGIAWAGGELWVNLDNDCGESETVIVNYGALALPDVEPQPTATPTATATATATPTATTVPPTTVPNTAVPTSTTQAPMPPNTGSGSAAGGSGLNTPLMLLGVLAALGGFAAYTWRVRRPS